MKNPIIQDFEKETELNWVNDQTWGTLQQTDRPADHLDELYERQDSLQAGAQEVHHDVEGDQHQGLLQVLRGPEPLQRIQVPVRGHAPRCLPHAVVRPTQQIHAIEGEQMSRGNSTTYIII